MSPKRTLLSTDTREENFQGFFRDAYSSVLKWTSYRIFLVLMALIAVISSRIALLNILAYEFSAITGPIVCHFTAFALIREIFRIRPAISQRSPYTTGPHPRIVIWGTSLGVLAAAGWLLFIPLVLILLLDLAFSVRNCDLLTGIGFYITIPVISSIFASSLGVFSALACPTRKLANLMYSGIVILFAVRIVVKLSYGHTIGLNDPFMGSFNLPLYDEEANLDSGFLYSRLFTLITSKFLLNCAILTADNRFQRFHLRNIKANLRDPGRFLPEIETTLTALVLIIAALYFQGPLGIDVTRRFINHELDGRLETEHFVIRYPSDGDVAEDLERIAEEHEYFYYSIFNEIQVAPDGPIRSYIYADTKSKTFLTGVGSSVYAKPWTGEIHVEYQKNSIEALKHELVHVMSAPMGLPFFGSSLLGAYGEGIAEGIQWDSGNDLTYHQWSAALREAQDPYTNGPFFPSETAPWALINRNFGPGGFFVGRISMNYYLSASYTRWFLDTYGIDAYKTAYIRNDTLAAINLSKEETAATWMEYLDHVPVSEDEISFAAFGFAPPKFTVQVCAHELAEHERLAGEFSSRKDWPRAIEEYTLLLDFSPQNTRYGYRLAQAMYLREDFEGALSRIREIRSWPGADAGWIAYLALLEGDIYARMGNIVESGRSYATAMDVAINESLENTATLRIDILNSPARDEFLAALEDVDNSRWHYERAKNQNGGWIADYYLGLDLISNRKYEEAELYFLQCLHNSPSRDFIRRNALYYLGICAYRKNEYQLASENFQQASDFSGEIFIARHPDYDGLIPLERLDSWSALCSDWIMRSQWRATWSGISDSGS